MNGESKIYVPASSSFFDDMPEVQEQEELIKSLDLDKMLGDLDDDKNLFIY